MKKLLFLVHRIPFPPNKGDKITSFNLLRYLSERFEVHLGAFVDDPDDLQHGDKVREYCADACLPLLDKRTAKWASLRGLLTGEALSLPYYRQRQMADWVAGKFAGEGPDAVLIFSGAMAQYLPAGLPDSTPSVLDLEDVDSDKWRLYAERHRWPASWLYRRESRLLLDFERRMAARCSVTILISPDEAKLFQGLAPEVADKVRYRVQGVDSDYFDPALEFDNPYAADEQPLVFVGAMDYWPNIDAAKWFASELFPRVRQQLPQASFYVVGMNPTDEVRRLGEVAGVTVTGGVPDVRPYLAHARSAVLPLRVARGIQNKALEAMAMSRPVLATADALDGIRICDDVPIRAAADGEALVQQCIELLSQPSVTLPAARECVRQHYNWDTNLQLIHRLLDGAE